MNEDEHPGDPEEAHEATFKYAELKEGDVIAEGLAQRVTDGVFYAHTQHPEGEEQKWTPADAIFDEAMRWQRLIEADLDPIDIATGEHVPSGFPEGTTLDDLHRSGEILEKKARELGISKAAEERWSPEWE
ncbi:MAG TPA: hypothetical protein VLF21_03790 [Candidatus Saccharimonadales bacterium]|nr:hypothetical protein [Candidatus Saccharimonadales bacterium]